MVYETGNIEKPFILTCLIDLSYHDNLSKPAKPVVTGVICHAKPAHHCW